MVIKNKIYIAGPRMGQNNFMYGIELKNAPKPVKSSKVNKNKSKRKSSENEDTILTIPYNKIQKAIVVLLM